MRVGIHSGKVICGFVGHTRYKYDVLSADVFKANDMESCGEAGRVHVSEATYGYLSESDLERFEFVENTDMESKRNSSIERLTTYFVTTKDKDSTGPYDNRSSVAGSQSHSRSGAGISRQSSVFLSQHQLESTLYPPTSDQSNMPAYYPAVPINYPMRKDDSMNQKQVYLDWFNLDSMSWALTFIDRENEKKFHSFYQHKINDDDEKADFVLSSTRSLSLSSRTTSTIDYAFSFLEVAILYIICTMAIKDMNPVAYWTFNGPLLLIILFVAVIDLTPLSNRNQPLATAYIRRFLTSYWVYQFFCVFFMSVPPYVICFFFHTCIFSDWGHVQMYMIVLSFIFFFNYPRVCAWLRCLSAGLLMTAYCVFVVWNCEFPFRFPIETLIAIFLLILGLLILGTLEFELLTRADFYSNIHEEAKKKNLEKAREKANTELRNVLPEFVISHIEDNSSRSNYSNSRKNCAIIFFYTDFFEHYTEIFKSGMEWVELLNELICDFDDILTRPKYSCIFKIKTISSTYMAASNLAPGHKILDWKIQAVKLLEVAVIMRRKLDLFSEHVLQFHKPSPGEKAARFSYKIGYNIGDVTTGVIGTTKPFFDIWGDSVNVASRMYSTAESNMCQVTEEAKKFLQMHSKWGKQCFKYRGEIEVKGKGKMRTYALNLDAGGDSKRKKTLAKRGLPKKKPDKRRGFVSKFYKGSGARGQSKRTGKPGRSMPQSFIKNPKQSKLGKRSRTA
ncbi:adenylate cyclase type 9-like isoform X2 [Convolutriloba macropyga]|uniref:adenylate cyclase type 9-like isoform X2 n=1 Tax=Convolutriloba macropyga TaxID=536237 RepID=UPI003F526654